MTTLSCSRRTQTLPREVQPLVYNRQCSLLELAGSMTCTGQVFMLIQLALAAWSHWIWLAKHSAMEMLEWLVVYSGLVCARPR